MGLLAQQPPSHIESTINMIYGVLGILGVLGGACTVYLRSFMQGVKSDILKAVDDKFTTKELTNARMESLSERIRKLEYATEGRH